jgi:DNA-binding LacI/PurR family transcriptional regulator
LTLLRERKAPTIHDVARVAKLSKSTVSNVIRNAPGVSAETRARVQAAITELGYKTNIVARQLAQQRTRVLGVVIGDLANPFYAEMAKLLESFAAARGFQVMFCNTQVDEEVELAGIRSLLEHRVAGLLFLAYAGSAGGAQAAVGGNLPVVFVTCSADWGDVVAVDDFGGVAAATQHLIGLGHRRIAYFADTVIEENADNDRKAGYIRAMTRAGHRPQLLRWDAKPDTVIADGETRSIRSVLTGPGRMTGIVAANDLHAIDVLDCADRLGLSVPGQLSVVGFDDIAIAGLARIGLTTIAQPKEMMAQIAIETLERRISGALRGGRLRQITDFTFVERTTTGKAQE